MKKKKSKNNTPRRKRMNRKGRLQIAKQWAETYEGKNVVKGYAKWFGVDLQCALTEVQLAGLEKSPQIKKNARRSIHEKQEQAKRNAEKRKLKEEQARMEDFYEDSDDIFSFIVGYTPGGVPYGITWDEWEEVEGDESTSAPQTKNSPKDVN